MSTTFANVVYVSKVVTNVSTKGESAQFCTADPQCNTATYFDSNSDSNQGKCSLSYGPTFDKLTKIPNTENLGIWTAPRSCN